MAKNRRERQQARIDRGESPAVVDLPEPASEPGAPLSVADAVVAVEDARRRLIEAVAAERAAGASWTRVGELLGVSKQTAFERFRVVKDV